MTLLIVVCAIGAVIIIAQAMWTRSGAGKWGARACVIPV